MRGRPGLKVAAEATAGAEAGSESAEERSGESGRQPGGLEESPAGDRTVSPRVSIASQCAVGERASRCCFLATNSDRFYFNFVAPNRETWCGRRQN